MAYITYTAKDGIYNLGDEQLIVSGETDSIKGGNLLTNPFNANSWTQATSIVSSYNNMGIKLQNTAPGVSNGYATINISTDSTKWYIYRVYLSDPEGATARIGIGLSASVISIGISSWETTGIIYLLFKGQDATTYFFLQNNLDIQDSTYWSNIEVLEIESLGIDETTYTINDNFNSSPATVGSWVAGGVGSLSIVSNRLRITQDSGGGATAYQSMSLISDYVYHVSVDYATDAVTGGVFIYIGSTSSNFDLYYYATSSTGTHTFDFKAPSTGTFYIRLATSSGALAAEYTEWDNITVRRTGNLIENGTFTDNVNSQWTLGSGASITGGTLSWDGTQTSSSNASQVVDADYQNSYVVTFTISGYSAGAVTPYFSGGGISGIARSADGTYTETISLTSAFSGSFGLQANASFIGSIDNVVVRRAISDISVNSDGLEIYGEVLRSPVNFDSESVAFTHFNTINYLMQQYNSNLDYGVTGFHVKGWFKNYGNVGTEVICGRGYYSGGWSGSYFGIYLNSNKLYGIITDDSFATSDSIISTSNVDDGLWHHFCFIVTGDGASPGSNQYMDLYLDGEIATDQVTITAALGSLSNTNATFIIGNNQITSANDFDHGDIALISTGATILTSGQIKQIYESEKILFEPDSVYSINGDSLGIEIDLSNTGQRGAEINKVVQNTLDGSRFTLVHSIKRNWQVSSVWIAKAELKYLRKFIEAVMRGDELTFDERGYQYAPDFPISVYADLDSVMYGKLDNDYYNVSFKVRET